MAAVSPFEAELRSLVLPWVDTTTMSLFLAHTAAIDRRIPEAPLEYSRTCEVCGKQDQARSGGWMQTCAADTEQTGIMFNVRIESFRHGALCPEAISKAG
jgi:hypothetical protein